MLLLYHHHHHTQEGHRTGKWLHHHEMVSAVDNGEPNKKETGENVKTRKILCRTENFVKYHAGMSRFVQTSIRGVVSQLLDGEAVLFKEKVCV